MMLCDMEDFYKWSHKGINEIGLTDERSKTGKHSLRLEAPVPSEEISAGGNEVTIAWPLMIYDV
jgi:hypothetical protein